MERVVDKPISRLTVVLFCVLFVAAGCIATKGEGFAIYLTKNDIPPSQMESLSHIEITDQPVVSINDIITYNAQTHEIKLTDGAFRRIAGLQVPVQGKSFVVCVDRAPIYWGAFWTPISSLSFAGVTIWKPYSSQGVPIITLELGYPSSSFYGGQDPRNKSDILQALQQAGKLVDRLSVASITAFPQSMKGYEIYSWQEDNQWHFTLITGTDRNKTLDEIVSKDDYVSEVGWTKVSVTGVDAFKSALNKLQPNEFVIWLAGIRGSPGQAGIEIELPPAQITDVIHEYAMQRGLDFQITGP